ncbi:glycosyltransferase involved in cell wall biosynthesis [Bradyrhizobium sp. i1.3.1]
MANSPGDLEVIVPNLHRRYSGVTATNRMVAPRLAKLYRAAWFGSDAPEGISRLGAADFLRLWGRKTPLIWHARRNNEMIAGVLLRALGWPLKLVFTSAAQRHHSWITRWLIRRMDAIIATSDISASFLKVKATVIPHGVDTDVYAPAARSRRCLRGSRAAGPPRDRLLRSCARAEGHGCVRRCDVSPAAALS